MKLKIFLKSLKQTKKKLCFNIRTNLILISSSGYEVQIKDYLRDHLFREIDYAIPTIIVPPIKEDIWHNFFEYEDLMDSKHKKREELGKIIQISKRTEISPSFRVTRLKDAKNEYADIIEREQMAKLDNEFLTKWFWILDVPKSREILARKENHKPNDKSPRIIHERIEIS